MESKNVTMKIDDGVNVPSGHHTMFTFRPLPEGDFFKGWAGFYVMSTWMCMNLDAGLWNFWHVQTDKSANTTSQFQNSKKQLRRLIPAAALSNVFSDKAFWLCSQCSVQYKETRKTLFFIVDSTKKNSASDKHFKYQAEKTWNYLTWVEIVCSRIFRCSRVEKGRKYSFLWGQRDRGPSEVHLCPAVSVWSWHPGEERLSNPTRLCSNERQWGLKLLIINSQSCTETKLTVTQPGRDPGRTTTCGPGPPSNKWE